MNLKKIKEIGAVSIDETQVEWLIAEVEKLHAAVNEIRSWDLYPEERKALEEILNDKNKL